MPGNALCAQDAAAREHANVSRRSQQHYATHEKMHSGGNSVFRRSRGAHLFRSGEPSESPKRQGNQKCNPIEFARFAVGATSGKPGRQYQVERKNAAANIVWLVLYDRQVHRASGHGQHGPNEDSARQDMPPGAFTERQSGAAREPSRSPRENMKKQNRRKIQLSDSLYLVQNRLPCPAPPIVPRSRPSQSSRTVTPLPQRTP